MTEEAPLKNSGESVVKKRTSLKAAIWALILLIGIGGLLLSANKYKKKSDQAKCILQMATIQKLIISYACLNGYNTGYPIEGVELIKDRYISAMPVCPAGGIYEDLGAVPSAVEVFYKCDHEGHELNLYD